MARKKTEELEVVTDDAQAGQEIQQEKKTEVAINRPKSMNI